MGAAKETLAEGAETVKRGAQRAFSGADDYVRESPWVAIGLAAVVGAVAGILVARRVLGHPMRVLWLLPKAAPALLRHIGAYVELVAFDLEQSRRDFAAIVIVSDGGRRMPVFRSAHGLRRHRRPHLGYGLPGRRGGVDRRGFSARSPCSP